MKKILFSSLLSFLPVLTNAQQTIWNGRKCAVALTYDDAMPVHLDNAIPILDSLGLKATFYLSGYFPGLTKNISRWKSVAANGHELGNHTLFHPCIGNTPGREWVNPTYDLSKYSVQRISDEIRMTNVLLNTLDGKTARTFAYPCGDTKIGDVEYYQPVKGDFVAARGTTSEMKKITEINFANVGSYAISGQSGEELINIVKQAQVTNSMVVFLFHGVGGGHSLNVTLPEHAKLLRYLKKHTADIWTAPFIELVQYAKEYRKNK